MTEITPTDNPITFLPIGYVESPIIEEQDEDWGNVESILRINPEYTNGLIGLEDFSHIILIFFMHQAKFNIEDHLVRHPRGRLDMPNIGIFAQRAKHRPNSIGITTVKLLNIQENEIHVIGLDAINGTPILDIKPYVSQFDRPSDYIQPEWINRLMEGYF
jgi:tRNA-Thr(GGU) m(6)t(6)A37 methyltransferase TsaA